MKITIAPAYLAILLVLGIVPCRAQIYSPSVLKKGQVDTTNLKALANGIYSQAGARTPREKAEAIWRFFLTDGRFVRPGFFYHIAGWAYEEPGGEVLDPIKLLNSYGFGLCYHIAPLLEAVWEGGGFEDARVWFLTGHTVAEVFYDGSYHYFDSDMMGYNAVGSGPVKARRVASVHEIEQNGNIILNKLLGPKQVDATAVEQPWYPADVRAGAIGGLAELFTTVGDNWVYPFKRYPEGHSMDFVLRPGERMIRYFAPENEGVYYLPYKFDGTNWREFPQEFAEYHIRTNDGPRSQKDSRHWATGRIEYRPALSWPRARNQEGKDVSLVFDMPCPYVIINAEFSMNAHLFAAGDRVTVETSVDRGDTWTPGETLEGPHHGKWETAPASLVKSEHGMASVVTGRYGYMVRLTIHSSDPAHLVRLQDLLLQTRFELNPRTLPALEPGENELHYRAGKEKRTELAVSMDKLTRSASRATNVTYTGERGQGYVVNGGAKPGEILFTLEAPDGGDLSGFSAGGRFLDLRDGLAPDKLTAEVRRVRPWPNNRAPVPSAELSWSTALDGPYRSLWKYDPKLTWKDGKVIDHTLRWPEVDRQVDTLPRGTHRLYIRYTIEGMAIDSFRMATLQPAGRSSSSLRITHLWKENGVARKDVQQIESPSAKRQYSIVIPPNVSVANQALILECTRPR